MEINSVFKSQRESATFRSRSFNLSCVLLLPVILAACGGDNSTMTSDGAGVDTVTFRSIQDGVFSVNCVRCHTATAPSAGLSLTDGLAYANLVGIGSSGQSGAVRVITNDPDNSYLIRKLEGAEGITGERMPRNADPLPAATIQMIKDWIAQGTLDN